jgi:hypothetical protein
LEVVSRTSACSQAHHTSLSRVAFEAQRYALPIVEYSESNELTSRGTVVRGTASSAFDTSELVNYLRQFVRFVREAVYIQGRLISQELPDQPSGTYRTLSESLKATEGNVEVEFSLRMGTADVPAKAYVRLVHGQLDVYKRGFRICSVTVGSRIGVSGYFDADILQPTAGRDTLESNSLTLLTRLFKQVEMAVWPFILADSDLLANHTRLLPDLVSHGHLEKLGHLKVTSQDKQQYSLLVLRGLKERGHRIFYTVVSRGQCNTLWVPVMTTPTARWTCTSSKGRNSPVIFSRTNQDSMAVVPNRRKRLGFIALALAKGSVALTG